MPDNWGYVIGAYGLAVVVFGAYWLRLGRREREVAALNVPLVHFSVYWWRTLHQPPSLLKPGPVAMSPVITAVLLVNLAAFALLYAYFVAKRMRVLGREEEAFA